MRRLKMKKWCLLSLPLLAVNQALAGVLQVEMADQLRSDGKIYVVVIIILMVVLGLGFFAFRLDRKISKLEKRTGEKED